MTGSDGSCKLYESECTDTGEALVKLDNYLGGKVRPPMTLEQADVVVRSMTSKALD